MNRRGILLFGFFIIISTMSLILVSAQTLVLQMNATYGNDTYISENSKTTNYGGSISIQADSESGKSERTLLFFNLSQIPQNSTIQNASFQIYLTVNSGDNFNLTLYRLTRTWNEMGVTWNTYDGANAWTTAGGDYNSNSYDFSYINSTLEWKSWNATNIIQEFVNGTSTNFGFILIPQVQTGNNEKRFASRENTNITIRPKLIINYLSDLTPPTIDNFIESPANNSAYSSGQSYKFNSTITDNTAIGSVWVEWQGINYTNGNIVNSSSVYTFTRNNLAAGTYNYRWWANDSYGNLNNSGIRSYIVNKATTALSITGTSPITYGVVSNFAGTGCPVQLTCSLNASNQIYGVGTIVFNYSTAGNENYTGNWTIKNLVVNQAENVLTLLTSAGWNYNYGTSTTFSCSATYGAVNLYKDNVEIANPATAILAAGTYNIKCNATQSQNYTSGIAQGSLTVNKISSQASLTFDKPSPQNYGNPITPTCLKIIGEVNPVLTLNGNTITSGQALILEPGNYNFNCSLAESQNYTASSNFSQFVIESDSTTINLTTTPDSPITYGDASNFSCYSSVGLQTILYLNGQDKTSENNLDVIRAAGAYIINCTSIGNQNYTGSSEQTNYSIDKAPGEISLRLNGVEEDITIDYPETYNINASTLYGSVSIFKDGVEVTGVNGLNITPTRNATLYNITAVSSGDENHSSLSLTRWLNVTLDVVAPIIIIESPQEGASYGYNLDLPLTFSVSDQYLDSCWYNLNDGENISLLGCENSTFNASGDGNYVLNLYSNDTLGNLALESAAFSVLAGAPTVILNSPIGIYLNSGNVVFRYVPNDLDLGICELWGNFSGEFALNQTDTSPINDSENLFSLILPDGTYKWNIRCNDSQGHFAFNGNKTFHVDTTSPSINLSQPTGTKNSRTAIPLDFSITDNSPTTCWYNIYRGENIEKSNTTIPNCSSTVFSVTLDADFILNLYASDSAGNFNSASSSFSVNTGTVTPPSGGSSGGGGGGGSSEKIIFNTTTLITKLELSPISDLILGKGMKKKMKIDVKNTGTSFLNNCVFVFKGDYASWLSSDVKKNLAAGEEASFNFDINVPSDIGSGVYSLGYGVECKEVTEREIFLVEILEQEISFDLIEVKRISNTEVKAIYSLEELSGEEQKVELQFLLVGSDEKKAAEIKTTNILAANSKQNFEILIPIDSLLEGNLNLLVNLNSKTYSTFVQEDLVLGAPISGFAMFGETGTEDNLVSGFLILAFLIFAFFMIKRILSHRKLIHKKWHHKKVAHKEKWEKRKMERKAERTSSKLGQSKEKREKKEHSSKK